MTDYTYWPIPDDMKDDVIFLEVIKPLRWVERPENTSYEDCMPVGAITWINRNKIKIVRDKNGLESIYHKENLHHTVHPENNRHCCNFSTSCFRILHTSIQKVRK
jgi:hypothetical protein